MFSNKSAKILSSFLVFFAISYLLWRFREHFLWIFPCYGMVFALLSGEKELRFIFIFLTTAIGFLMGRISGQQAGPAGTVMQFAEVASLWLTAYFLNYLESSANKIKTGLNAEFERNSQKLVELEKQIRTYREHKENRVGKVQFQSELSYSVQYISSASSIDDIKAKIKELGRKYVSEAEIFVESGAPKDVFENWAAERKIPLLVGNAGEDKRFNLRDSTVKDKSVMVVPLAIFGSIVGFIKAVSTSPNKFRTEELRFLELISTISGASMENIFLFDKVRELAIKDGLTKLYTHRMFQTRIEEEILRSARTKVPFSLIMADIDHFKKYNDTYGHQAGDEALKSAAAALLENIRDIDFAARYGGEEFAVILTGVGKEQAAAVAEGMRKRLESETLSFGTGSGSSQSSLHLGPQSGCSGRVTASFGISEFPSDAAISSQLIRIADERLYRAKEQGRNMVAYE
ncbi:MAG: sensor domain-containing diguanylate cyclase [Elusimicrobia bacterium]|nr:sensor domain-containing diguanylate cyclase [Elusimicrobiota bacterium]